jgi:outer membrane protein OmpA-like peptidoglycan-associated protein
VASTLAFRKVIVSVNGAIKIAAIKIAPEGTWSGSPLPQFWRKLKMKNRTIFAVLLAVILAVPVFAQDNSAPMNQPATTQASSSQASSSQTGAQTATATGKDPLQPETREGFWGHMNPFARKKYVARQTQPIRDRVNELDELTASNTKAIRDTDARAQAGILLASNKANEADQHAIDAGNKAQAAQQTAQQAHTRLNTVEQVVTNIDQYQPTTQAEILFKSGQTVLSKNAKTALDEMATPLKDQRGYVVEVQGFSSGRGQAAIASSQKMAESVVRYLVLNHDIPVYRIYLVGMGNAPVPASTSDAKPKRITGGRVEVSLLKNNLEQLATTTTSTQDQQQQK